MTLNVLNIAMRATAPLGCNRKFQLYKYIGSAVDAMGRDVPQYAEPVEYVGSLQPVQNKLYQQLGLDLAKNYRTLYCSALIEGLAENAQPDRIVYMGKTYETVENQVWFETNGWTKAIVCELKVLRDDNQL